jgi:hypothetical protein
MVSFSQCGAFPWLFCFLVTSNFPYRLVLLLLPVRLWLTQQSDSEHSSSARLQLSLWLIAAWLMVLERWGVAFLLKGTPTLIGIALTAALKQSLLAVLSLVLGWSVLGWLVRTVRTRPET